MKVVKVKNNEYATDDMFMQQAWWDLSEITDNWYKAEYYFEPLDNSIMFAKLREYYHDCTGKYWIDGKDRTKEYAIKWLNERLYKVVFEIDEKR